jgi:hypothetical protein
MGDSARTIFTIPAYACTAERRDQLSQILFISRSRLDDLLRQPPAPDPEAGGDSLSMRLVQRVPCLIWERDEAEDGGIALEDCLIAASVPLIRENAVTRDYMASRTVSDGTTTIEIRLDHGGCPIIGVSVRDGRVIVDTEELADVQRSEELMRHLLTIPAEAVATA